MTQVLEEARTLAHGTYDDVIVVEHRAADTAGPGATRALHVVLEMPEGSRVIDTAQQFEVDGVLGVAPAVGTSYRLIVEPPPDAGTAEAPHSALRYETRRL